MGILNDMQVKVSKKDENNNVKVSYESEPGRGKEAYEKTLGKLGKNLTIKGFRKGHAPAKVVEEHFGPDNVRAETLNNEFLLELLDDAFKQENLSVVFVDKIEKVEFDSPDDKISIEAQVELFPEVKLPDYKKFKTKVKVPKVEIEKQIIDTIEKVRLDEVSFTESTEAIAMGDEIIFDFDGSYKKEDGSWEPKPGMKAENYQAIVESGRFIENFLEQMVGMKTGDEKELDVKFPETYHDKDLAGSDAKFKVKVHKVSKPSTPELDDDFAKQLGLDNVEALKNKAREELERVNVSNRRYYTSEALIKELIEATEMNISQGMVERELHHDLAVMQKTNKWDDNALQEFIGGLDMDREHAAARKKLERSIFLTTVIKEEELEATEEDIQQAFQDLNLPPDFDTSKMDVQNVVGRLNLEVLTKKAVDLLIDSADIDYEEVPEEEIEKELAQAS